MLETDLYAPVKQFLETRGYTVKSEVLACDVVALDVDAKPVIVELKTALSLQLFYQAVDRLALADDVYVAVPRPKRGVPTEAVKLCRRIGIGLLVVSASGSIDVLADPAPYAPRKNSRRRARLLGEFTRRSGDRNTAGSVRRKLMTAYRQDALRCAYQLSVAGAQSPRSIRLATQVDRAAGILRTNVYGWFVREARGVYALAPDGEAALAAHADELQHLFPLRPALPG